MSLTCGRIIMYGLLFKAIDNRFRVVIFVLVAWTRAHYTRFGLYFILRTYTQKNKRFNSCFLFARSLLTHYWFLTASFHTFFAISLIFTTWFFGFFFSLCWLLLNCILISSSWFLFVQFLFFLFTKDDADEMNVNDYDDAIQALIHIICYAFDLTLWTKCTFVGDDHWLFANAIDLIVFLSCVYP